MKRPSRPWHSMSWCTNRELAIAQRLLLLHCYRDLSPKWMRFLSSPFDLMVKNPAALHLGAQIPKRQRQEKAALKAADMKTDGAMEVSLASAVVVVGTA